MHFNFWAPASNKVIARGSLLRRILIWPRDASVDQCDQMLETSSLILSKIFPKNSHSSFYSKVMFFKMAQKSQNILDTIVRKFVTKIFKYSPNLVTLREDGPTGLELMS